MAKSVEIIFKNLPRVSVNNIYSGNDHWTKRKRLKDNFYLIIKSQFKIVFPKTNKYIVSYDVVSTKRPYDASNQAYVAKMIEDVIFEDDKWDIVTQVCLSSRKGDEDYVKVTVTTLDK